MKGCRPLSEDEVAQVSQSFGGTYAARDKALFLLGIKNGFRISELLSLRVGDVYQHERVVDRVTIARRHMKKKVEGRGVILHVEGRQPCWPGCRNGRPRGRSSPPCSSFRADKG